MKKSNNLATAVMATLLSTAIGVTTTSAMAATPMEKCYGIAKAGKNDCGTSAHACAGQSATNNDPNEWMYVPVGTCAKTPGGSLTPPNTTSSASTASTSS